MAEIVAITSDGRSVRSRRRSDDIRSAILRAAAAEFGERGYAGATTAAIARRSNVAENQIFRHFNSKAELFKKAVFDPLNESFEAFNLVQLTAAINGDESERIERYIAALSRFIGDQKQALLALVRSNAKELGEGAALGRMGALDAFFQISQATLMAKRGANPSLDPRLVNRVSFATVLACVMFGDWLFPEDAGRDELTHVVSAVVMQGLDALG